MARIKALTVGSDPPSKFKLLRCERDINLVEHLSAAAEFGSGGSISGEALGSFELGEDGKVTLSVDGVDYSGHCCVGYDEAQNEFVACVTALSTDGAALWAMRATGQDRAFTNRGDRAIIVGCSGVPNQILHMR